MNAEEKDFVVEEVVASGDALSTSAKEGSDVLKPALKSAILNYNVLSQRLLDAVAKYSKDFV